MTVATGTQIAVRWCHLELPLVTAATDNPHAKGRRRQLCERCRTDGDRKDVAYPEPSKQFDWRWREKAACAGEPTALWFPKQGDPGAYALAVCGECPVRHQCAREAIINGERDGIWAGIDLRRDPKRKRLKLSAAQAAHQ